MLLSIIEQLLFPLIVGILLTTFTHWLNKRR